MGSYYPDTDRSTEALQARILRDTPPWRKAQMLTALTRASRQLALAGLRQRHPNADATELKRRMAGLLLGEELASKFYGKLPSQS